MKSVAYLLLLLATLLASNPAQAQPGEMLRPLTTTGGEKQLAALIAKSPVIIEGHAEGSRCFWDATHTSIYTATPITVYKVFKGEISSAQVEVITWGGQVGNDAVDFSDLPQVSLGLRPTGMFFLEPTPHRDPKASVLTSAFQVVEGKDGLFKYGSTLTGGAFTHSPWQLYPAVEQSLYPAIIAQVGNSYRNLTPFFAEKFKYFRQLDILDSLEYARKKSADVTPGHKKKFLANPKSGSVLSRGSSGPTATAVVSGFSPATINAGTFDSLTINGSGFGTFTAANPGLKPRVQFVNADDATDTISTPALNIVRFNDTKIVLYVPSNDGSSPGRKRNQRS